jgi:hypothetical protein
MRIPCPQCQGHGFNSHLPCVLCDGRSFVDSEQVCDCGRPAVRIAGDSLVCFSAYCYDKAIEPKKSSDVSTYPMDMTEEERLEHYKGMFGI